MVVAALGCAASLVVVSSGLGATPDTVYEPVRIESPNPQDQGRFGERSALAGDIDGDGVGDFFISAFQQEVQGVPLAGRVYLISGRTRSVIRSFESPEPQRQQRFGFTVASPGDLSGDGKRDVVVSGDVHDDFRGESSPGVPDADPCGAAEPNGCYENTGQVWAYDGATGTLLYTLENPRPQSNPELPFSKVFGFGTAISSVGDLTGDGRPEVIVGAASNDVPSGCAGQDPSLPPPPPGCRRDQGQAFVFNGATGGAPIRTYDLPAGDERPEPTCNTDVPGPGIGTCGFLGQTVQGLGDINGDGVTDHLVQGGTYGDGVNDKEGRIYVFSGATGARLLTIDNPSPPSSGGTTRIFGLQTVEPGAPGDVNNDGSADIYGNGFQSTGPTGTSGEGRAWIFSGKDGSILYNLFDPSPEPSGGFAFSAASTDYDLDGIEDEFMTGQNGSGTASGGGASIFSAPSVFGPTVIAPALKDFQAPVEDRQSTGPPPANGLRFGRTVEAPGDLNQDGEPDYVIGAPQIDVAGNADQGTVYVFLSKVPTQTPTPTTPSPTPTPPPGGGDDDAGAARLLPNLVRPGFARAVQSGARSRSGSAVARVAQSRGGRIVVRLRGRMIGNGGRPCGGRIKIGTRAGSRRVATRTGRMGRNCRYGKRYVFAARQLPKRLRPRSRKLVLRVAVRYQGNSQLRGDLSPTKRVKVRR